MIPANAFTLVAVTNTFREPNNLPYKALSQTVWGGKLINDADEGRMSKYWMISYELDTIVVKPVGGSVAFTQVVPNITSLSMAFDEGMRLIITYTKKDGAYLYYSNLGSLYQTRFFAGATSCRLCVDDARSFYYFDSDVLFVYTLNGKLNYRVQRDHFDVEYLIGSTSSKLLRVGQNVDNRLQFELGVNIVTEPPTPIPRPRIMSFEGTQFPLNAPMLLSFSGKDQIIGVPVISSFYGDIYPLNAPVMVSFQGTV